MGATSKMAKNLTSAFLSKYGGMGESHPKNSQSDHMFYWALRHLATSLQETRKITLFS